MRKKIVAPLLCHPECNEGSHKCRQIYHALARLGGSSLLLGMTIA
jgi:hypothetical protein